MERNFLINRSPIEKTPQTVAAALNSHAENWDELKSPISLELRTDGFCILLTTESSPVETLLYCRNGVNELTLHQRIKAAPEFNLGTIVLAPIKVIESGTHPQGFRGVVFTQTETKKLAVLEIGYFKADFVDYEEIARSIIQTPRIDF